MKKRNKIIISTMSGLAATTSVVAPLSSCSNQQHENNLYQNIDKEYGVTSATYEKLKGSFANEMEAYTAEMSPQERAAVMDEYVNAMDRFDQISTTNRYGWTSLTSAVVNYARDEFGFKLARQSSVKWSQLASIYNGMAKSMRTYMESSKLAPTFISKILTESRARFDTIEKNLKAKYGNDALGGMIEAKKQIVTCFEDANDEIALVSASQRLADFADEYQFDYIEDSKDNRLDEIVGQLEVNKPINDTLMRKLFTITKKSDPGVPVYFECDKMIPMFTVTPTLKSIQQNKANNTFSLSIDFSLIKSYYLTKYTPEQQKAVTAHLYSADPTRMNDLTNEKTPLSETIKKMPIKYLDFAVLVSSNQEILNIQDVYFNPESKAGKISFKWADDENQAYEAFFDGLEKVGNHEWKGTVGTQTLANAGLLISYDDENYLSCAEILSKMNEKVQQAAKGQNVKINLAEGFLTNCNIESEIKITEDGQGHNEVVNKFHITYKNSKYREKTAAYDDAVVPPCIDYKISNHYFDVTNQKFNEAYHSITLYTKKELHLYQKEATEAMFIQSVSMAANLVSAGFLVYLCWENIANSPLHKKTNIISLVLSFVILALQAYNYCLFKKNYYDKIKDYNKKVDDFLSNFGGHPEVIDMIRRITIDDPKDYFVIFNNDGSYDQHEYAIKCEKFRSEIGIEKARELNEYYGSIMTSETMKTFILLQEQAEVDKNRMKRDFSNWTSGGKYWLISWGLTANTSVLALISYYLQKKIHSSVAEQLEPPIEEEVVDEAEICINEGHEAEKEMWDGFQVFLYAKHLDTRSVYSNLYQWSLSNPTKMLSWSQIEDPWYYARQQWEKVFNSLRDVIKDKHKVSDEELDKILKDQTDILENQSRQFYDVISDYVWDAP